MAVQLAGSGRIFLCAPPVAGSDMAALLATLARCGVDVPGHDIDTQAASLGFDGLVLKLTYGAAAMRALQMESARHCHLLNLDRAPDLGRTSAFMLDIDAPQLEPMLRALRLATVAGLLVPLVAAQTIYWPGARLWSAADSFQASVTQFAPQDLPPLTHMVAMLPGRGYAAGRQRLTTHGLAALLGYELELCYPSALPVSDAASCLTQLQDVAALRRDVPHPGIIALAGRTMRYGNMQRRSGTLIVPIEMTPN